MNNIWQLQEAKSKFSEVIDRALSHGVQIVTRRGKKTAVVLPFDLTLCPRVRRFLLYPGGDGNEQGTSGGR